MDERPETDTRGTDSDLMCVSQSGAVSSGVRCNSTFLARRRAVAPSL